MVVPLPYILGLSVALFALGAIGVLIRRNILLALVVAIFRQRATVYVDDLNILKW
jgi:NADH:ubiquinone oxidoreductase subunit K